MGKKQNIFLPEIKKVVYSEDGNYAYHHFGNSFIINNCELVNNNPLIIKSEGIEYYFTSKASEIIPDDYKNVLQTFRKPTKKDFETGSLKIKQWLKHPAFTDLVPDKVVKSWKEKFKFIKEDEKNDIKGLRPPQIGALYSILAHTQNPDDIGIVVMPTGTGKTETMLCSLVANQCKKLLVAVPSDSLRNQLSNKFLSLGLLKEFGIMEEDSFNPIVGIINKKFSNDQKLKDFLSKVNVVITTMAILSGTSDDGKKIIAEEFSHLFVDEAHHSEASTWKDFINRFEKEKVFLFTATPYRNDGKKLDGKFIFNFSLKKAQQQKYYKKINYLPVREYDKVKADEAIAEKAIEQLRKDLANGHNHILMARCGTKRRAQEVFKYYEIHKDLNPVLIYTGTAGLVNKIDAIKNKEHKIVVCVDMLGEGFDLPELKIAAVHDERQSLPITLQFIGRFTRVSYGKLGDASFITNVAYPPIKEELERLYAKDSDWNILLPTISEGAAQKEINFRDFLKGFSDLDNSKIPFQNIVPAMSTVVYKTEAKEWSPNEWRKGIKEIDTYEHQYSNYNPHNNTLVIILGKVNKVDWGDFDTVQNMEWHLIVIIWDYKPNSNRIFINSSIKGLTTDKLVEAIFPPPFSLIRGMDVFKIFHEVNRLVLYNVGARKGTGKDISFQSFFGRNVQDGLKLLEQGTLVKNNIFGVGYRDGEQVSLGCSVKGKIWSYLRGNLNELVEWCKVIGEIVEDPTINPNTVLKHTLVPVTIIERPKAIPIFIEWNEEMFSHSENRYEIKVNGHVYDLANSELTITDTPANESLQFAFQTEELSIQFKFVLGERIIGAERSAFFEIKKITDIPATISYGKTLNQDLEEFLNNNAPTFWFADGSQLFQTQYVELKEAVNTILSDNIITDPWTDVSLEKESQGISPYIQDSIQHYFINKIKAGYDLIYDDDGKGEIADIIAINDTEKAIDIHLFHLKYAKGGVVSNDINNLYQVCGQAQKSLNWKYRKGKDFFHRLLKRKLKNKKGQSCSRIIKGTEKQIETLLNAASWTKEMKFNINIVQPGLSKLKATNDILLLLGNTHHFLHTVGNVELKVYTSV